MIQQTDNEFFVIGEETIQECKTFDLNRLMLSNSRGIIKYKEYLSGLKSVSVIGITDDGRIPLVVQHRPAIGRMTLEIPGGKIEPNESPVQAAARELREETGYSAKLFHKIAVLHPAGGYSSERTTLYFAKNLSKVESNNQENLDIKFVSLGEAINLCCSGQITDTKTTTAIFMLKYLLDSEFS